MNSMIGNIISSDTIKSALIAGIVSVIISIISLLFSLKKSKDDFSKYKLGLNNQYTAILYERRLQYYPEAFTITDLLAKANINKMTADKNYIKNIDEQLRIWKSGIVNLIISQESLNAYNELINCFKAQPAKGTSYNDDQLQRIYNARVSFRNALRKDVQLLHEDLTYNNKKIIKQDQKQVFLTYEDMYGHYGK